MCRTEAPTEGTESAFNLVGLGLWESIVIPYNSQS